ncbi:MAG TPA: glycosyltransferase family 4 protein [Kofleriaceae bacterium]|nr:glycosyltransferase family 4 protein [Kofleriaceae bacterium]
MRILYLSMSYLPGRKASSVHVMNMSSALAANGHTVTLIGKQGAPATQSLHDFYGVPNNFTIRQLPRPKRRGGGAVFAAAVLAEVARLRKEVDLVYCRDIIGAQIGVMLGLPTVHEQHSMPLMKSRWQLPLWRRLVNAPTFVGLTLVSQALRDDIIAHDLAPKRAPICVAHDAATPPSLGVNTRRPLAAPPRIGYVGSIFPGRGIELIIELAKRMPDCVFPIYGGSASEVAHWQRGGISTNLQFHGFVPPGELNQLYQTFDVVLMPYPRSGVKIASGEDNSRWCSPMKMFEYMASGTAIVSSDLPVLGEVLRHEDNALIAQAGDVSAWQAAVTRLISDEALRQRVATNAYRDLCEHHTWQGRAKQVLATLGLT